MDFYRLKMRKEIPIYEKEKVKNKSSNLVKTKKVVLYKYYRCDYCNDEIRLDAKHQERSGGIVTFPATLTKRGEVKLALCNKCLKNAIYEFSC